MKPFFFATFPLAVALTGACTSHNGGSDDGGAGDDSQSVTCQADSRVQSYAGNMTQMGTGHLYQVVLVSANPAPPAVGLDEWTVKVLDAAGKPVSSPTLTVKPYMPDHKHGPSVQPTWTANADGTYDVKQISFFMPGVWEVTFGIQTAAGTDSVVFTFCVA